MAPGKIYGMLAILHLKREVSLPRLKKLAVFRYVLRFRVNCHRVSTNQAELLGRVLA